MEEAVRDIKREARRLCADGRCFIEFDCLFPDLPKGAVGVRIEKSLSAARDAVLARAEQTLSSLAAKYRESRDPHKHLRQRPLCLRLSFFLEEEKRAYRITWRLSLSRGGRVLAKKEKAARFDKQSGRILLI